MNSSLRFILALALQLSAASAFLACGGESDDDAAGDDDTQGGMEPAMGTGELKIAFSPMYSAFEPDHDYKIPAIVEGVLPADIKSWTASDMSAVSFTPTAEGTMIQIRKAAGEVKITAETNDGKKGTATLRITEATPDDWRLGQARYTTGGSAIGINRDAGMLGITVNQMAQCSFCHGAAGSLMVAHTPQQAGGYSDEELVKIFTEATKPAGIGMRTNFPEAMWKSIHKWNMQEADRKGVVVYLRSLTPEPTNSELDFRGAIQRAFGDAGFGGFGRRDGGQTRNDAGTSRPDAGTTTVVGMDSGT